MLIQAIGLSDSISEEYMYPIFLVEKHIKVSSRQQDCVQADVA